MKISKHFNPNVGILSLKPDGLILISQNREKKKNPKYTDGFRALRRLQALSQLSDKGYDTVRRAITELSTEQLVPAPRDSPFIWNSCLSWSQTTASKQSQVSRGRNTSTGYKAGKESRQSLWQCHTMPLKEGKQKGGERKRRDWREEEAGGEEQSRFTQEWNKLSTPPQNTIVAAAPLHLVSFHTQLTELSLHSEFCCTGEEPCGYMDLLHCPRNARQLLILTSTNLPANILVNQGSLEIWEKSKSRKEKDQPKETD